MSFVFFRHDRIPLPISDFRFQILDFVSGSRLSDFLTLTTYAQVQNLKSKASTFLQAQPI
ncbi:MAG: hypothetical protein EAZ90_30395 [Oscillatoriales cyanobacterium]|nr:MAG: hypothetical protein EAZ94_30835 [Oscillatoriales cyanobacterium]TAE28934.1 MAG: hypothetical protein EAZ93_02615 [Oscillatoriales cyanobacterium]TAE35490.1 MAG: hypothetical protein EAZ90_30395 [Oscillatoriales cyanobacterium]TAE55194.1 MAG: hypothetical protein EAZ88_07105 [Oscillatoriales cyanobacterium]TAE65708.1 MAG: hypothetical protein EAZ86_23630 [Oscillatoriales cyanobacterium]